MNFQNKIAVITGSTTGIGEAVAEQLHKHGAKVVIVSRSSEQAKQKAEQLSSQGQQAMGIGCDVSQPEQVRQMIDEVIKHFGRLDYAVNIKGIKNHSGSSFAGRIYPSYRCVQKSASKKFMVCFCLYWRSPW